MLRRTRFVTLIVALILMTGLVSASVQAAVTADSVISIAQSLRGKVKYAHAYDTTNLKFDCSGFVLYVFRKAGLDLRTNDDDYQVRSSASRSARPTSRRAIWSSSTRTRATRMTLRTLESTWATAT